MYVIQTHNYPWAFTTIYLFYNNKKLEKKKANYF